MAPSPTAPVKQRGRRRTWPLRAYFAALVILFVVAAVGGAIVVHRQAQDDARRAARQDAEFAAKKAVVPIAEGIGVLRPALEAATTDPRSAQALSDPDACSAMFVKVGAFPAGHFEVLRSDGSLVCSSRPGPPATRVPEAGWLGRANAASGFEFPVADAATGRPNLLIAAPFPGGIAAAFLELDAVGPELASAFGGRRGLEFLVTTSDNQTILARSIDPVKWVGQPLSGTPFTPGQTTGEGVDGTPRLYGEATVPGVGWKVYAGADHAAALASANRLSNRGLMIIGFALLVILAAAFVVERRIARPIRKLGGSVQSARGGQSAPGPLVPSGPTEVMTLADDFETLMAAVQSELSERTKAEEAARASERTYRMLFEDNPQPMWIHDADTHAFLEVNDAAVLHYGYSREEFLAMTVDDIQAPEHTGHVRKDGSVIQVETTSHTVTFGDRPGQFVIAHDVTERERVQRQLFQKQRLESLGELAGGVAHDFNNLLAVMMNYAAFVRKDLRRSDGIRDAARGDRIDEDLEQIEHAAERGARLTHQLLAFARSEVVRTEALDVNEVVEGIEQLLRRTIGEHVELVPVGRAPVAHPRRSRPARAGARQPGGERARRHAGRWGGHRGNRHGRGRRPVRSGA